LPYSVVKLGGDGLASRL